MPCRNVGGIDRALRLALGVVLLTTALVLGAGGHAHAWTVGIVGALVLASGAVGFCPPYVILGISTAKTGRSPARREASKGSGT